MWQGVRYTCVKISRDSWDIHVTGHGTFFSTEIVETSPDITFWIICVNWSVCPTLFLKTNNGATTRLTTTTLTPPPTPRPLFSVYDSTTWSTHQDHHTPCRYHVRQMVVLTTYTSMYPSKNIWNPVVTSNSNWNSTTSSPNEMSVVSIRLGFYH